MVASLPWCSYCLLFAGCRGEWSSTGIPEGVNHAMGVLGP